MMASAQDKPADGEGLYMSGTGTCQIAARRLSDESVLFYCEWNLDCAAYFLT